jgi:hypothetical protein
MAASPAEPEWVFQCWLIEAIDGLRCSFRRCTAPSQNIVHFCVEELGKLRRDSRVELREWKVQGIDFRTGQSLVG